MDSFSKNTGDTGEVASGETEKVKKRKARRRDKGRDHAKQAAKETSSEEEGDHHFPVLAGYVLVAGCSMEGDMSDIVSPAAKKSRVVAVIDITTSDE